jgi:hypothetical protein
MSKTKTLSVRVPIDVYDMIQNTCKQRGLNKNQLLTEVIAQTGTGVSVQAYANGGMTPLPEQLDAVLSGVGGVATGTLVYHILNNHLPKDRWDEETRSALVWGGAVSLGLLGAVGLNKLLKKL